MWFLNDRKYFAKFVRWQHPGVRGNICSSFVFMYRCVITFFGSYNHLVFVFCLHLTHFAMNILSESLLANAKNGKILKNVMKEKKRNVPFLLFTLVFTLLGISAYLTWTTFHCRSHNLLAKRLCPMIYSCSCQPPYNLVTESLCTVISAVLRLPVAQRQDFIWMPLIEERSANFFKSEKKVFSVGFQKMMTGGSGGND